MANLTQKLDRCPPFLAWIMARKRPRHRTLTRIAQRLTWAGVKVSTVDKFFEACGVNPSQIYRHRKFLREHKDLTHLTEAQRRAFKRCCAKVLLSKSM